MKKSFKSVLFAAIALLAVGCITDKPGGHEREPEGDEVDILLKLRTPGGFSSSKTRALNQAGENAIDNVWVLVFERGGLVAIKPGTDPESSTPDPSKTGYSGAGSFTVTFEPEMQDHTYKLVVLANAQDILENSLGTRLSDYKGSRLYADVIAAITAAFNARFSGSAIPMWGEKEGVTITRLASVNLELMRALARVDIGVGRPVREESGAATTWDGFKPDGVTPVPFELTSVHIMRPAGSYTVIPDNVTDLNNKGRVSTPTIPRESGLVDVDTSVSKFRYITDIEGVTPNGGGYTSRSIYIPEAKVRTTPASRPGDNGHEERTAIVVGGLYDGDVDPSYYRLDFLKGGALIDILRNTLYQFNITDVVGRGHPTPQIAYGASSMNMTVDIVDWSEIDLDHGWRVGDYYFAMSTRRVVFSPSRGLVQSIDIATDIPDFTLSLGGAVRIAANGARKHTSDSFAYSLSREGTSEYYTLTIETLTANVFSGGALRDEWSITIGSIENISLDVSQEYMSSYVLIGEGGDSQIVYPEGTTLPIEIVSGSEPVISVTGGEGWIGSIDTPTRDGGVWSLQTTFTVAPFIYGTDGTERRTALVSVTIEGETTELSITQQEPRLIVPNVSIARPDDPNEGALRSITVQTNLPASDVVFNFAGFASVAGITHGEPVSSGVRGRRFEVTVDFTRVPTTGATATYTVTPAARYNLPDSPRTGTVTVDGSEEVYRFLWRGGQHIDGLEEWTPAVDDSRGSGYFFPWNTSSVEFTIGSNRGLKFNADASTLGDADEPVEDASTTQGYTTTTPYTFTFPAGNYSTTGAWELGFTPASAGNLHAVGFSRVAQRWNSNGGAFTTKWSHNGTGGASSNPSPITIESNISWKATSGAGWLTLSRTNSEFGAEVSRDDRTTTPNTDPEKMVASGPVNVRIAPITTLNDLASNGYKRTATITFTNLNDANGGLDLSDTANEGATDRALTITQFAPRLQLQSTTLPIDPATENIPRSGATYDIHATTNLQGWGVKVLSTVDRDGSSFPGGEERVIAESTCDATITAAAAAGIHSTTVDIPDYIGTTERILKFVLYRSDVEGAAGEVAIGTIAQAAGASLEIDPDNTTQSWDADNNTARTITVRSNRTWNATLTGGNAARFEITAKTGTDGNGSFRVGPREANSSTSAYSATLTISTPGVPDRVVTLTHGAAGKTLRLTPAGNPAAFTPAVGGPFNRATKTVTANVRWQAQFEGGDADKFEFVTGTGSTTAVNTTPAAMTEYTLDVQPVGANNTTTTYSTTVKLTSADDAATVSFVVTQSPSAPNITLSPGDKQIWSADKNSANIVTIGVTTNWGTAWEIDPASYTADWTIAKSTNSFTIAPTAANGTVNPRTATIRVRGTSASGYSATVATLAVEQQASLASVAFASNTPQTFAASGAATQTFDVTANVPWEIEFTAQNPAGVYTVAYLGSAAANGTNGQFTLKPSDNGSIATRTATVRVKARSPYSALSSTSLPVVQAAAAKVLMINNTSTIDLTAATGGTSNRGTKTITANVRWKATLSGTNYDKFAFTGGTSQVTTAPATSTAYTLYVQPIGQNVSPAPYQATVTISSDDGASSQTFIVRQATSYVPVSSITINPTSAVSVDVGATTPLSAAVLPTGASNKNVTWSSNAPTIASVNPTSGVVTGVSVGSATITATAQDGTNVKGSKSVSVISSWKLGDPVEIPMGSTTLIVAGTNLVRDPTDVWPNNTRNVFATYVTDYGDLYQWGFDNAVAYESTTRNGWHNNQAIVSTWNPCPQDPNLAAANNWRLPTVDELRNLINATGTSGVADGTYTHTEFTNTSNDYLSIWAKNDTSRIKTLRLPAAGTRSNNGAADARGWGGQYWSVTTYDSEQVYHLAFSHMSENTMTGTIGRYLRKGSMSVRCVRTK